MDERHTPLSPESRSEKPEVRTQQEQTPSGGNAPEAAPEHAEKKYDLNDAYAEFDNGYTEDAQDEVAKVTAAILDEEPVEDPYAEELDDEFEEWEERPGRGGKIALIVLASLVGVLIAAYIATCALAANRTTALKGTKVMGVDVGGLSRQQVEEMWEKESDRICGEMKIPLVAGGKELDVVSVADLGVSITPQDAADCAMRAGRTDKFLAGGWNLIRSMFGTTDSTVRLTVDDQKLDRAVDKLCDKLGGTLVEGSYRLDEEKNDGLYVTKPRDGVIIDRDALCVDIRKAISTGELGPVNCTVETVKAQPFDLAAIYEEIHGEMANAGYNKSTGELTDERIGVEFNLEEALALLANAKPGEEFVVPGTVEFPAVGKEELEGVLFRDLLGTYSTVANGTQNRQNNVRKAAGKVNGTILNSGDKFSFNNVVGDPSQANGYYPAPAYVGGKTVDVYGGGVCQVASTLYYATQLSNLKIVERRKRRRKKKLLLRQHLQRHRHQLPHPRRGHVYQQQPRDHQHLRHQAGRHLRPHGQQHPVLDPLHRGVRGGQLPGPGPEGGGAERLYGLLREDLAQRICRGRHADLLHGGGREQLSDAAHHLPHWSLCPGAYPGAHTGAYAGAYTGAYARADAGTDAGAHA